MDITESTRANVPERWRHDGPELRGRRHFCEQPVRLRVVALVLLCGQWAPVHYEFVNSSVHLELIDRSIGRESNEVESAAVQ